MPEVFEKQIENPRYFYLIYFMGASSIPSFLIPVRPHEFLPKENCRAWFGDDG
jgi:hypothetical protein